MKTFQVWWISAKSLRGTRGSIGFGFSRNQGYTQWSLGENGRGKDVGLFAGGDKVWIVGKSTEKRRKTHDTGLVRRLYRSAPFLLISFLSLFPSFPSF